MNNLEDALKWIVGVLQEHQIPFQITGGFAAKLYGSKRDLNDIDIDIPDDRFAEILADIKEYVIYGPIRHIDETWDVYLVTLNYKGQEIDLSGADSGKILNKTTNKWNLIKSDLSTPEEKEVFGIKVPVQNKQDLIEYKSKIGYEEQKHLEDIQAIDEK